MDALTFIVFGFIALWAYWSIKHEGIFWIPRTVSALGGIALWIYITFVHFNKIENGFLQLICIGGSMAVITIVSSKLVMYFDSLVEKRVGKDPYKKIPEKKIKKNPTSEEYSEMLDEIDRLSEK
tara:strand:+ start:570 stop:941 length:372 start_codon:yes stop_codon:yes gene_type:complete